MTDADLDRILRAADPAAHRTAPLPGPLPAVPARRPVGWVPVGAAAAVVAVVGAAIVALPSLGEDGGGVRAGAPGSASPTAPGSPALTAPGSPAPTGSPGASVPGSPAPTSGPAKPDRPHTVSAGAEFERAHRLLGTLQAAVPAAYTLPAGGAVLPIGPGGERLPAASFQAVRDEGPYEGYTGFVYDAGSTVTRGGRVGTVAAAVYVGVPPQVPCAVAEIVSWGAGTCRVLSTPAGRVALVDAPEGPDGADPRTTQWAVFRHPDGTVVRISQGPGVLAERTPRLTAPVWSATRLAQLATDRAFTR
jgi:hypothetical protein